jgi:hypothetical protein|tara:strand:+ start:247 stop:546 length:300 start_codon:yes stop_codon:yes gene_type:complete
MTQEQIRQILKMFFIQASKTVERIELKTVQGKMDCIDLQTKKAVDGQGKEIYFVNFLMVTESKDKRDKSSEFFGKAFNKDEGFIEIGGTRTFYKMGNFK